MKLWRPTRKNHRLNRPWHGTFVGIVLDLTNPLPLQDVYAEAGVMVVPEEVIQGLTVPPLPKPPTPPQPEAVTLKLSSYGTQLLTRELGTAIRADVASHLAAGRFVNVILDGVEDITPSCVDDAFGKLSEIVGSQAFASRVSIEGGQPVMKTLIQFVLKIRQRTTNVS